MRYSLAVLRTVIRSPVLRRIQGGFLLFSIGEWATWLAIVVYAFDQGGATEAAIVGFVIGVPSVLVAPAAAIIGDRWPRARVLLASYALQSAVMAATALALVAAPPLIAYLFAMVAGATVVLSRPALSSLLPEVVETPDQLTAANVASGIAEGAGALAGPLLAGLLLGVGGSSTVYLASAIGLGVAAVALLPIARASSPIPIPIPSSDGVPEGLAAATRAMSRELTAGAAAILRDRRLASVFAVIAAASALLGALGVFIIVIAIDLLGLDDAAAGYLTAASGLGALAGSVLSVTLVGRERLSWPLIAATAFFGLSVAALALVKSPIAVAVILVATGVGWSFAYVAATTLTQRLAGDDVMTRVFGVAESVTVGAEAAGGLLVPVLIYLLGPTGALATAGLALPIIALLAAPVFVRADRAEAGMLRELRIIRAVPMFRPLAAPVLERLAGDAVPVVAEPGHTIIEKGEIGDRFYIMVSGRADVEIEGGVMRRLEPGATFGEIALLHDMPRTATVRAIERTELLAIEREPFLAALTGQPRSRAMADQIATRRLARDPEPQ